MKHFPVSAVLYRLWKEFEDWEKVFFNAGVKIQDQGGVIIDDGALIGHNVVIATLDHSLNQSIGAI